MNYFFNLVTAEGPLFPPHQILRLEKKKKRPFIPAYQKIPIEPSIMCSLCNLGNYFHLCNCMCVVRILVVI